MTDVTWLLPFRYYHERGRYLEADVDVSTNVTAGTVTQMCVGVLTTLVIDMAIVIEVREVISC